MGKFLLRLTGVLTLTLGQKLDRGVGKYITKGQIYVSTLTEADISRAERELGYRPSGVARSLRQRATRTLGLIVTEGFRHILEIARQAVPEGYGNSYFWVKPERLQEMRADASAVCVNLCSRQASPAP